MADKDRAEQAILAQALVAFGQGTGAFRVSREACLALIRRYRPLITKQNLTASWDTDGVQALERVRAIGRLAAHRAVAEARTVISREDVSGSIREVEKVSKTSACDDA